MNKKTFRVYTRMSYTHTHIHTTHTNTHTYTHTISLTYVGFIQAHLIMKLLSCEQKASSSKNPSCLVKNHHTAMLSFKQNSKYSRIWEQEIFITECLNLSIKVQTTSACLCLFNNLLSVCMSICLAMCITKTLCNLFSMLLTCTF